MVLDIPKTRTLIEQFPFLEEYKTHIWLNETNNNVTLLWVWNYWIILTWLFERIVKIWKTHEDSLSLKSEYRNHLSFYLWLDNIKEKEWDKYNCLRIPEVAREPKIITWEISGEKLFIYEMERIKGKNLLSFLIIEELNKVGILIDADKYTDKTLEETYRFHTWKSADALKIWVWLDIDINWRKLIKSIKKWARIWVWDPFTSYLLHRYFPDHFNIVVDALINLKQEWLRHTDLHPKNVMITYEWDNPIIYIIDFWIVEIKPKK